LPGASSFIIAGLTGDTIPNVPETQLYGSVKYNAQLAGHTLSLIADATYRGKTNTEFRTDSLFNLAIPSYTLVDLYANYAINDHFTVGAYVKNVGDELAIQDGIATFQDPASVVAARPRTIGAVLRWAF
jgi:outer membrane receptor protein involved in Fe transport